MRPRSSQVFASLAFIVAMTALLVALAALRKAYDVVPFDEAKGNPPWAKPVQPRQVTGPSLREALIRLGQPLENALEDDDR
jgi:hypothetical protein